MLKKIMLVLTSVAIISVAFAIYTWRDESWPRYDQPDGERYEPAAVVAERLTTQPAQDYSEDKTFTLKGARIPPGEAPKVDVFDERGNARIMMRATRWAPISDTEFHLTEPAVRLLLPGGQLAYVWAEEARIALQRGEGSTFNPKSGWLGGDVRIFIDRSRPEDREANPDLLDIENNPERLVKMWLDDVTFDMDLGRLETDGPVRVQSEDATIEGRGLELTWSETDRRIRLLRIPQGKRATLRSDKLVDLGLSGAEHETLADPLPGQAPVEEMAAQAPEQALPVPATDARQRAPEPLTFLDLDDEDEDDLRPSADRVDTYHVEFHGDIVAEQRDGDQVVGRLTADLLRLLADFGREERAAVEHTPAPGPDEAVVHATEPDVREARPEPQQKSQATVELVWTGELLVRPIENEEGFEPDVNRLQVIAEGNPVVVHDVKTGEVACLQLEYHAETRRVWLRGSPETPVAMKAGGRGQLFSENTVYFDRGMGMARIEGAGRMVTERSPGARRDGDLDLPDCMRMDPAAPDRSREEASDTAEIAWTQFGEIEFGIASFLTSAGDNGQVSQPAATAPEYIRRAFFEGDVQVRQEESAISADRLEALFADPISAAEISADRTMAVERILANGNVVFQQGEEGPHAAERTRVDCQRLEVELTVDPAGRNVPRVARAFGNVVARQDGPRTRREIRAQDRLTMTMASVPRPVTPAEQERFEAGARRCGFGPESPQWRAFEERLRSQHKMVTTSMSALGNVRVTVRDGRDEDRNLDVAADALECDFTEEEELRRALVTGRQNQPAAVASGDMYVRGPQIVLDMLETSIEVPGSGIMRFHSREDLDGRPLLRPIPVVVSWTRRMAMRGPENVAIFSGDVRANSENSILDCNELRIEFQNLPKTPAVLAVSDDRWLIGPLAQALRPAETSAAGPGLGATQQMRKRPVYLRAHGNASMQSTAYEAPPPRSAFHQTLAKVLPDAWLPPTAPPDTQPRRMISRIRASGPQIGIDLVEKHFGVEGAGNLILEDYRLPADRARESVRLSTTLASSIGGLDSRGPSQTVFTWQNSMTFLNRRNTAVFYHRVHMRHAAGAHMAMKAELAAAMDLDLGELGRLESRLADLTCERLLVTFERQDGGSGPSPLSRATKLDQFEASGNVMLTLDEGKQSVSGTLLKYTGDSSLFTATGSSDLPAQILEQDERTGRLNMVRADPGKSIQWNQRAGTVRVQGSSILGTGR